jgi:hypothetical protein
MFGTDSTLLRSRSPEVGQSRPKLRSGYRKPVRKPLHRSRVEAARTDCLRMPLFFAEVLPCFLDREPAATINFRNFDTATRAWGPFDLAPIARQVGCVAIAFKGPCYHQLSALLLDRTQIEELSVRPKARLRFKLAPCCVKRILVWSIFTFRNRPRALVLLGPEWSSRMN